MKNLFLRFLLLFFALTLIPALAQQNKSIKLITPVGGEYFRVSDVEKIEWSSTNVNTIAIDYSIDNGKTWLNIANYLDPAVGNYYWSIPEPTTNQCRIKVRDRSDPSVRDYSARNFLITMKPEIKVWFVWKSFPLPGCSIGEMTKIHWSVKNISTLNLEFTTDEGYSWQPIASNISASSGDFYWQIPNSPSSQCNVAAYDSENPLIRDVACDHPFIIYPTVTSVNEILIPQFKLEQNYPNPFNPSTTIKYSIPIEAQRPTSLQNVTLKVYDVLGNEVATLVNEEKAAGNYEVKFHGYQFPSGLYFYQLKAGNLEATKKLVLIK